MSSVTRKRATVTLVGTDVTLVIEDLNKESDREPDVTIAGPATYVDEAISAAVLEMLRP